MIERVEPYRLFQQVRAIGLLHGPAKASIQAQNCYVVGIQLECALHQPHTSVPIELENDSDPADETCRACVLGIA